MADSFVTLPPDSTGKKIDTRTESTNSEHRQVFVIGDAAGNDQVAPVQSTDPASNSQGIVVRDVNTSAIVGALGGTIAVQLKPGTLAVSLDPGYTLGNIGSVTNITNSVAIHVLSTGGTIAVSLKPGTLAVSLDPGYTIGSIQTVAAVTNITNSVAVHVLSTGGTINVALKPGTLAVQLDPGHLLGSVTANAGTGTFQVFLPDTGHELGSVRGITNSIAIHHLSTAGTLAVKLDPGYNVVNTSATLVVPIVTTGTFNGVSTLGKTIAGPTTSRVLKIFAIALSTTAQVHTVAKFTNGAGTAVEFWRYALQAPSQGIAGANLAVSPPGYLFATAAGATLALVLDTASLVHYSVAYFEETA